MNIEGYVHVYRNLHKNCYSVRQRGKVVAHLTELLLEDATFHVQPRGREKVLLTGHKNVHAYVKGKISSPTGTFSLDLSRQIMYDPYSTHSFLVHTGSGHWSPIERTELLYLPSDFKMVEVGREV